MSYTFDELCREACRLAGTVHGGFLWIRVAGPNEAGTGIEVEVHPGGLAEAEARGVEPGHVIDCAYPVQVIGESDPIDA